MDAKLFCVLVLFTLFVNCQARAYPVSQLTLREKEERKCPSINVTFYHTNEKSSISGERYVRGEHVSDGDFSIEINATKIRALAFNYQHKEVLFVDNDTPNIVLGVSRAVGVHSVVHEEDSQFDWIVVDPVTNNLYFADNNRGIGVCSGHGSNTSCTLLISKASNVPTTYRHLILYWQHGVMFWIQKMDGQNSEVKMASMNGHHIRALNKLNSTRGLALNTETGHLYASQNSSIRRFDIKEHTIEYRDSFFADSIFVLNCYVHSLEEKLHDWECTGGGCYATNEQSKIMLKGIHVDAKNYGNIKTRLSNLVSTIILDSDLVPKQNPCKSIQCGGICVLTEAFPEPLPDCVCETCNKPKIERIVEEKVVEKVKLQKVQNPLNGVLVATTIILLLTLAFILALIFSSKLRILLREQIAGIFGKKTTVGFVNQASRGSTVSTATNEI